MKKKSEISAWNILSVIFCVFMLAAEGLMLFKLFDVGIVPDKLMIIIVAVLAVLTILLCVFLFPGKKNGSKTGFRVLRVIAFVLALVLGTGCTAGYAALSKLNQTFQTITQTKVTAQVNVYVLKDDRVETVQDLAGYTFGVSAGYDVENTQRTVAELEKLLGESVKVQEFEDVPAVIGALYTGEVQAMILNSAYANILADVKEVSDFVHRVKLVFQYDVLETVEGTASAENLEPQQTEPVNPLEVPFVLYISGSDSRNATLTQQNNSDVNILAVVNPKTKQILLVNTPRDYFVPNPAGDGALDKLTHCGVYGVECSVEALSDFYDQPIDYYAKINFNGFKTLIDAIGGVTIYSEEGDGVMLDAGENYMDGETALRFARNRMSYGDGDNARGRHQMQLITAVIDKLTSGAMISNYSEILDSLEGLFATSMPNETITGYIKMQLEDMATWQVFSYAVSGSGGEEITYSIPGLYAYVMYPDEEKVAYASGLMDKICSGGILTESDIRNG